MSFKTIWVVLFTIIISNADAQLTYDNLVVRYDSAWTFKNLQLIPIRFKAPGSGALKPEDKGELIAFDEAMKSNKIKVKEIIYNNGADVNWLEVTNTSKETIVINSGSLLAGGKQDRMTAETKILRPGKKDYLKVFCIEKGRWDRKPKKFAYSGTSDPVLKKVMDKKGRQHEVWKEIERQYSTEKSSSETYPYLKLNRRYAKLDLDYITYFTNKYKESDSLFAGFLAITGDHVINCELFSSADLTSTSFSTVLRGLVSTAIIEGSTPLMPQHEMKVFMDKFLTSQEMQKTYLSTHGKIDYHEGKVMHLIAYDD